MNEENAGVSAFKRKDAASYDEVTDAFDRYTERFTGAIAARVVEIARLEPDERVLDVGTGTGVVAFGASRRLTGTGNLVGIDFSDGMLKAAREKAQRAGSGGKLTFEKMDAEALTFADAAFDCVLSLYALRHFPRPDVALGQMRRVLRPGGRAVVAVGSAPPLFSSSGLSAAFRRVGSVVSGVLGKGDLLACGYLNGLVEKHLPLADANEEAEWTKAHAMHGPVARMMQEAGFRDVRTTWTGQDGIVESKEDFWEVQVTFSSLARKRLATAPAAAIERLQQEFDAGCIRTLAAGGRLRYPTGALVVTGNTPA